MKIRRLNISLIIFMGIFIGLLFDAILDVGKIFPAETMRWTDVLLIAIFMISFFTLGYFTHKDQMALSEEEDDDEPFDD